MFVGALTVQFLGLATRENNQLPIMPTGQQDLRSDRPAVREEHVPLGIPDVSLGSEELICR
jgi:hypothetical protein